jgi:hypothetical protein
VAPNAFSLYNPANLIVLASLSLEFYQMAFFPLQNNPYGSGGAPVPSPAPTFAPTLASFPSASASHNSGSAFWGSSVFSVIYVTVSGDVQYVAMWMAVALVMLLIAVFSSQFLWELSTYGELLQKPEDKDAAKDSFFFSFTGSIVYGHGKPKNISFFLKTVVGLLTDGLFLVISLRLLNVFSCDYSTSPATLFADRAIVCWEGRHKPLAVAALMSYAFYVPLSVMVIESPPSFSTKMYLPI